jgi:hypothetical protein
MNNELIDIALLIITDGRKECMDRTLDSLDKNSPSDCFSQAIIIDDSMNPDYAEWLVSRVSKGFRIVSHGQRRGFCGAIQSAWKRIEKPVDFIFHLEDDFIFNQPIPIYEMAQVLIDNPHLAQMALRRQPWGAEPKDGGFVKQFWDDYEQKQDEAGHAWFEHRKFFTTNPSIYPAEILQFGWPDPPHCEGAFGFRIFPAGYRSAFWGLKTDEPWVEHIGIDRAGGGY